jgi:inosine/xanthosine triphosphate pyrophosphatase family protein
MPGKSGTWRERLQVLEITNEVLKGMGDVKGRISVTHSSERAIGFDETFWPFGGGRFA